MKTVALPGGSDSLYAVYAGDPNYTTSASSTMLQVINFSSTPCITGPINGGYTVMATKSICFTNATINGGLTVQSGGAVSMTGTTVNGGLNSSGATGMRVCGSTINGSLTISNSTGFVMIGDGGDDGTPTCGQNNLNGSSTVSNNGAGFEYAGNKVSGSTTFSGNTAASLNGEDAAEVEGNTISGSLVCATSNSPALISDGQKNTVSGSRSGQCSATGF